MSTTPEAAVERSAEQVNEDIRALWFRSGGMLNGEERQEYQRLVLEWASALPHPRRAA